MIDKKLGFVVLNYNGKAITQQCVDSLLKYYPDNYICVVDNNSSDNSIADLQQKYTDHESVIILQADKNYGFAVGNNIGINHLRSLGVEYIAIINNDTIFQKSGLIEKLNYIEKDTGVVSLELSNVDGSTQIPYGLIKSAYKDYFKMGLISFLLITKLYYLLRFFKRIFVKKKSALAVDYSSYKFIISGAGYILTPYFFENYSQLFNHTFMYNEEHILALYLQKAGLKSTLIKDTKIIHLEAQTAKLKPMSFKKSCKMFSSWFKGLRVINKSVKNIQKRFSNRNYNYKIIKGENL